jgi:uncharacterized membrane protein YphA (DoxX/SURF4 family)
MLVVGRFRRSAAITLAMSLIPTTVAGHAFWRLTDKSQRAAQRIHFEKNVAILGGLALAASRTTTPTASTRKPRKGATP